MSKKLPMKRAKVTPLSSIRVTLDIGVKPSDTTETSATLLQRLPGLIWHLLDGKAYRVGVTCGRSESTMCATGSGSHDRLSEAELLEMCSDGLKLLGDIRIKAIRNLGGDQLVVNTHSGRVLVIRENDVADYAATEKND